MNITSRNDTLAAATAGCSDAEHLVKLDVLSRQLESENSDLLWVVKELLETLPTKRDWLNPDLEKIARTVLKTHSA